MSEWPPVLDDLKADLKIDLDDVRDDAALSSELAAAIDKVAEVRGSAYNFAADPDSTLPSPTRTIILGTVRLAGRWDARRRSPDGLVQAGEFGTSRIPNVDADIERMLGIGRYAGPVIA